MTFQSKIALLKESGWAPGDTAVDKPVAHRFIIWWITKEWYLCRMAFYSAINKIKL